ncbi:head-tail connector protein [Flavobacterium sp.]|uniref:head-tail connector protein n=1 Tax=Flavobacterium sp. TaxID=239 RepID=UPI003751B73A
MAYIDVITLETAKNYLKVDEDLTDDDALITSMINGALRFIEKRTNHILYIQQRVYTGSCQVKVYDYPINSIVTNPAPFKVDFSLFTIYPDVKTVTLNVGYAANTVTDELIQAALQMIKVWYYESEKQVNSTLIPESVMQVIDINRRFI